MIFRGVKVLGEIAGDGKKFIFNHAVSIIILESFNHKPREGVRHSSRSGALSNSFYNSRLTLPQAVLAEAKLTATYLKNGHLSQLTFLPGLPGLPAAITHQALQ